jgi:hypothetical protein
MGFHPTGESCFADSSVTPIPEKSEQNRRGALLSTNPELKFTSITTTVIILVSEGSGYRPEGKKQRFGHVREPLQGMV